MTFSMDAGVSSSNATGLSLFSDRRLVAAGLARRDPRLEGLDAMLDIANKVRVWVNIHGRRSVSVFVTEWPQVYPGEREKDPNDLLPLCGLIGHVSALFPSTVTRKMFLPKEWKGNIEKGVFVDRIVERLDPAERRIYDAVMPAGLRHNAADAVGIGLHYLGRLGRKRVVHNEG